LKRPIKEEALNAATHGCGFLLAVVGTVWMVWRLLENGSHSAVVTTACGVYGLSLTGLYLASALSHVFFNEPWHSRFRGLDQGFIYLLIAGTYTPLAALFIKSWVLWVLFGVYWAVAIFGCISKVWFSHRLEHVSTATYVLLGWVPGLIGLWVGDAESAQGIYGLAIGGIVYNVGVIFLLQDKRVWYFHGIWHVFVIAGSAIHFFTIVSRVFDGGLQ